MVLLLEKHNNNFVGFVKQKKKPQPTMITTITKVLNSSGQMLSMFIGVSRAEMPLVWAMPKPQAHRPACDGQTLS